MGLFQRISTALPPFTEASSFWLGSLLARLLVSGSSTGSECGLHHDLRGWPLCYLSGTVTVIASFEMKIRVLSISPFKSSLHDQAQH